MARLLTRSLAGRAIGRAWLGDGLPGRRLAQIDQVTTLVVQHARGHGFDLTLVQLTKLERTIGDADQPVHPQADRVERLADLAILAFANADLKPDIRAGLAFDLDFHRAVFDAFNGNACAQDLQRRLGDRTEGAGPIATRPAGGGQFQGAGEGAIIGQKQQAFRGQVEAADRNDPADILGDRVEHGLAAFRVGMGRHQTVRLVIAPELGGCGRLDALAVHFDVFAARYLEGGCVQGLAVDLDPAALNHAFDLAARGHAGASEEFGNTFRSVGSPGHA